MRPRIIYRARVTVAGFLALSALSGVARSQPSNDPRESPEVRRLVLAGVRGEFKYGLERSIKTRPSICKNVVLTPVCRISRAATWMDRFYLDRTDLAADMLRIRAFYWKRGYREAAVDTSIVGNRETGVTVTFTVTENRPTLIARLAVDYDSTLIPAKRITRGTALHAGQPFDIDRLDSTRVTYLNEMWSRGHSDGEVEVSAAIDDSVRYTADVRIRLIPNRATTVGQIVITGLGHVQPQTVLNALSLRTGEPFRRGDQLASQRTLYESNLFRLVTIGVADSGPPRLRDSVKRIDIMVSESPLHEARVGPGLSNIDFVQAQAHFTHYNLLGAARRFDADGAVGNLFAGQLGGRAFFFDPDRVAPGGGADEYRTPTWSVSADLRQPGFMRRPKDQAGLSAFAHRRSSPGIFVDRGYGGAVTLTRHVRVRAPASLTYRYEVNRVTASDVYFCVSYGVCDTLTIGSLRAHQSLSPLSLTGFIDRADIPLNPTRGYTARLDLEHASTVTGSDYGYTRAYLDGAAHHHVGERVFSARLRLGVVRSASGKGVAGGVLHPRKRFYAGGASSVRGISENQLGPRILTVDPVKLAAGDSGGACSATTSAIAACDPNRAGIANRDFLPQALGGTSVVEASVEMRFPTPIHRRLSGAVFLDAGIVGQSALESLRDLNAITRGSGAVTPGFGVRFLSLVGPIRFDIGINPRLKESLPVVTEIIVDGRRTIVPLTTARNWTRSGSTLLDRLTLHFSIGQPY